MSTGLNFRTATAAAAGVLLLAALPLSQAAADGTALECVGDGNVWVVVEHDEGSAQGCADDFSNGLAAVKSAGIDITESGGFVSTVDGQPSQAGAEDWWSYWSATPSSDGTISEWTSYMVGAGEAKPAAGSVEGWRLAHSFTEAAPPPSVTSIGLPSTGV